jgi:tripartite-type tricarboxylate transporter receptor subunit TctC
MTVRRLGWLALPFVLLGAVAASVYGAAYPTRPITFIVPWGAGGGTDAVGRMMATLLEKDLGRPVNVVNRTGGSGVVGHGAIAQARPDGYTFGIITVEIAMMHHQGLTKLSGASFVPLGLINVDPATVQVRADAPYRTIKDLVEAIRAHPGKLKGSGTAQGGVWQLSLYGMLRDVNVDPAGVVWVPSMSNAAGLLDLVAGSVDMVPGSHPEARALMEAGKVKSLVIMDERPSVLFPKVPTVKQALGSTWTSGAWRGIAAPKGLPKDIEQRLRAAVKKAYESAEFQEFMHSRGFGATWLEPEAFAAFMAKQDEALGKVMKAVGLAR